MPHTGDNHSLKLNSNNAKFHNNKCVIYRIYSTYTHRKTIYMIKTIISIHKLNKKYMLCIEIVQGWRHNVFIIRKNLVVCSRIMKLLFYIYHQVTGHKVEISNGMGRTSVQGQGGRQRKNLVYSRVVGWCKSEWICLVWVSMTSVVEVWCSGSEELKKWTVSKKMRLQRVDSRQSVRIWLIAHWLEIAYQEPVMLMSVPCHWQSAILI